MRINPPITNAIIFSGGGSLVIRQQKIKVTQGKNILEIMDVPASFDPDTVTVEIVSEYPDKIKLAQVSVKLPDKTIVEMVISKERAASNNIIINATDIREESRKKILEICESAYYRKYEDMFGELDLIIQSEIEDDTTIIIKYFIIDTRIRWIPSIQVDLDEKTKEAKMIGYINVENNSDFLFENVELEFAEFELTPTPPSVQAQMQQNAYENAPAAGVRPTYFENENKYRNIQKLKRVIK